eukprot:SAG11_NODE_192_length_12931_cov_5.747682_1_plen_120_part_00
MHVYLSMSAEQWANPASIDQVFPTHCAEEYLAYQMWDTIQAMCSYLRGVLATQALLEGVGVGKEDATSQAAVMTWVLRDGASMIGALLFTSVRARVTPKIRQCVLTARAGLAKVHGQNV